MTPLGLEDLRAIELNLAEELDRVCRTHGLTCFLAYGSLIGALRNGGFIPWDDDMDFVMLRDQYETLLANFDRWRTSENYRLTSYHDKRTPFPFAKLVDARTCVREQFIRKDVTTGVWVDVFPLDDVATDGSGALTPRARRAFAAVARIGLVRSFQMADPAIDSSMKVRAAKRIVCPAAHRLDGVRLSQRVDEAARRAGEGAMDGASFVADVTAEGNPGKLFPKRLFADAVPVSFEGRSFAAPADADEFLSIQYGDWRTPPAENERPVHVFKAFVRDGFAVDEVVAGGGAA